MVNKKNEIHVVDMFCGGGGESTSGICGEIIYKLCRKGKC